MPSPQLPRISLRRGAPKAGDRSPALQVHVEVEAPAAGPDTPTPAWLARHLRAVATRAGVRRGQINLLLVGDARMRQLHRRYLGLGSTTDVLTFDLRENPRGLLEGDLVLCVDQARREARRRRHATRYEIMLYAVHGLLHLLGHDDHDPAQARAMHRREDQLLLACGLRAVYADTARPARRSAKPEATAPRRGRSAARHVGLGR